MAQDGATSNRAHARSCEKADCASLTVSVTLKQLYTDAALVLYTDASRRVAVTAPSGVLDVHVHGSVEHASWVDVVARTLLMVVVL